MHARALQGQRTHALEKIDRVKLVIISKTEALIRCSIR